MRTGIVRSSLAVIVPVLLLSGCAPVFVSRDDNVLLAEDFNTDYTSGLSARLLANPNIELASGAGPDGSDAIRVAYIGNDHGSRRVLARYPLSEDVEQATLAFDVRFDDDFRWQLGGKLHGLGPRHPVTGGSQRRVDGWSARMMFRPDGRCSTYLYDQTKDKKYGIGTTTDDPVFRAGQWHHVVFQVKLNAPMQADGFARILIDDREVLNTSGVVFRGRGGSDTLVHQLLFSTFHGGNSKKWTPVDDQSKPVTVYAWFDNFRVTAN
jgi:hypothetical protein